MGHWASRKFRHLVFVASALVAASCGSMGMSRGVSPRLAEGERPVVDNEAIARELGRRPQLPERARVGVFFRPATPGGVAWRWSFEERESIVASADEIESFDVFPLSESLVEDSSPESLRLAAARHGADALLVVDGRYEQASDTNGWAAAYALVIPILFAPAGELKTVFHAEATMFDVRNGYLYMAAEAEVADTQERAHLWLDSDEGVEETRLEAVDHLSKELARRFESMLGQRPGPAIEAEPDVSVPAGPSQSG